MERSDGRHETGFSQGVKRHEEPVFSFAVYVPRRFIGLAGTVDPVVQLLRGGAIMPEDKVEGVTWSAGRCDLEVLGPLDDGALQPLRTLEIATLRRDEPLTDEEAAGLWPGARQVLPPHLGVPARARVPCLLRLSRGPVGATAPGALCHRRFLRGAVMKRTYHIYAIRLDDAVLGRRAFRARNPGYVAGKPCYYVGSSIYPPQVRFEKHKAGVKASRWVREFGLHVAARKCREVWLAGGDQPARAEREFAERLRAKGYGVWQN